MTSTLLIDVSQLQKYGPDGAILLAYLQGQSELQGERKKCAVPDAQIIGALFMSAYRLNEARKRLIAHDVIEAKKVGRVYQYKF